MTALLSKTELCLTLGGLLGCSGLYACVEAALVAACRVLVQHALLNALIEDGDGLAVGCAEGLGVAGGDGLAHGAQGATQLALVGAVDRGFGDCLARTL